MPQDHLSRELARTKRELAEALAGREKAEAESRETRERLEATLSALPDIYFEVAADGRILDYRAQRPEMLYAPPETFVGRRVRDVLPKESHTVIENALAQAAEEGKVAGVLYSLDVPAGRRWFEMSLAPKGDPRSDGGRFIALVRDVTERKAAEDALRERQVRMAAMIEAFDGYIFIFAEDFRIEYMNEPLIRRTGRDATGELCYRVVHDLDSPCPGCVNERVFRGETVHWEERSPKDGRWYYIVNSPLRHADGRISKQAMVLDTTERKEAEEALRRSEEKYRTLVDGSLQGLMITQGLTPLIVLANRAIADMLGYTVEELRNLSPRRGLNLVHPSHQGEALTRYRRRLAGVEDDARGELRFIRKDGGVRWMEVYSRRVEYQGEPAVQTTFIDISERKWAEAALRESEERFRGFLENLADAAFECDATGHLVYVNRAASLLMGSPAEELLGRRCLEFLTPESREPFAVAFERTLEGGSSEVELTYQCGVICRLRSQPLRDREGGVQGVFGVARDVTDRRRAERLLERERSLFVGGPVVVLRWQGHAPWRAEYVSPNITQFGYEPEDFTSGRVPYLDFIHPDDRERVVREVEQNTQRGARSFEQDYRILGGDGEVRWVYDFTVVSRDDKGRVTGYDGYVLDMTERRLAEDALRESEAKYRGLVEGALLGLAIIQGAPPRVVLANRALADMLGCSVESLIGSEVGGATSPVWIQDVEALIGRYRDRLAGRPAPSRFEIRVRGRDGDFRWLAVCVSRVRYEGAPAEQVAFVDVSERKRMEEDTRASLAEKDVLLRESRHRVKSNLQVVSGLLGLQAERIADPASRQAFVESKDRLRTMGLIHETLCQSPDPGAVRMAPYLRALVDSLPRPRGAGLSVPVEAGDVVLDTDAAVPCGLIVTELVSNALQHAFPEGGPGEVRVTLDQSGGRTRLCVRDNGVGLRSVGGERPDALGLRLVRLLVGQLGGVLEVDGEGGVAFNVEFESPR